MRYTDFTDGEQNGSKRDPFFEIRNCKDIDLLLGFELIAKHYQQIFSKFTITPTHLLECDTQQGPHSVNSFVNNSVQGTILDCH